MVWYQVLPGLGAQDPFTSILITLPERNRSVEQTLNEISLQCGYDFTYDASLIADLEKKRFGASELPLADALESLFDDPSLQYRLIGRNIVLYRSDPLPPARDSLPDVQPRIRGRVVDKRTGKALAYATIALYGSTKGTISNQDGDFAFKYPGDLADPMLVVTHMGYKNQVRALKPEIYQEYLIEMEKELIPLQEVIIRYTDPYKLLNQAIRRIPENYLQDHAAMTAFYRESVKKDKHSMLYFESVLDVGKGPYRELSAGDQVGIRKGRKITDTSAEDTVIIKLRSGVFTALSLDVVKSRPDFLLPEFVEYFDLEFSDMVSYGDRLVYVISFRQKEHIPDLLLRGKLYLDQENLAIVAADFEYDPEEIRKRPDVFLVSSSRRIRIWPTRASYHVEYKALDGKHYLSQVRGELGLKVKKRRKWIGARYNISFELAVTGVEPGTRLKLEREDRLRPGLIPTDQQFDFDPDFWGVYNIIEPEASLLESIRKIEGLLQELSE